MSPLSTTHSTTNSDLLLLGASLPKSVPNVGLKAGKENMDFGNAAQTGLGVG